MLERENQSQLRPITIIEHPLLVEKEEKVEHGVVEVIMLKMHGKLDKISRGKHLIKSDR